MKPKSDLSRQLYELMLQRGYEENFCDIVTKNLNTDFTASRMIGYLYHYDHPPVEEIADEMISILSDRNRIMQKKSLKKLMPGGTIFCSTALTTKKRKNRLNLFSLFFLNQFIHKFFII